MVLKIISVTVSDSLKIRWFKQLNLPLPKSLEVKMPKTD